MKKDQRIEELVNAVHPDLQERLRAIFNQTTASITKENKEQDEKRLDALLAPFSNPITGGNSKFLSLLQNKVEGDTLLDYLEDNPQRLLRVSRLLINLSSFDARRIISVWECPEAEQRVARLLVIMEKTVGGFNIDAPNFERLLAFAKLDSSQEITDSLEGVKICYKESDSWITYTHLIDGLTNLNAEQGSLCARIFRALKLSYRQPNLTSLTLEGLYNTIKHAKSFDPEKFRSLTEYIEQIAPNPLSAKVLTAPEGFWSSPRFTSSFIEEILKHLNMLQSLASLDEFIINLSYSLCYGFTYSCNDPLELVDAAIVHDKRPASAFPRHTDEKRSINIERLNISETRLLLEWMQAYMTLRGIDKNLAANLQQAYFIFALMNYDLHPDLYRLAAQFSTETTSDSIKQFVEKLDYLRTAGQLDSRENRRSFLQLMEADKDFPTSSIRKICCLSYTHVMFSWLNLSDISVEFLEKTSGVEMLTLYNHIIHNLDLFRELGFTPKDLFKWLDAGASLPKLRSYLQAHADSDVDLIGNRYLEVFAKMKNPQTVMKRINLLQEKGILTKADIPQLEAAISKNRLSSFVGMLYVLNKAKLASQFKPLLISIQHPSTLKTFLTIMQAQNLLDQSSAAYILMMDGSPLLREKLKLLDRLQQKKLIGKDTLKRLDEIKEDHVLESFASFLSKCRVGAITAEQANQLLVRASSLFDKSKETYWAEEVTSVDAKMVETLLGPRLSQEGLFGGFEPQTGTSDIQQERIDSHC